MTQYIYICGQQRVFNTAQVTICLFVFFSIPGIYPEMSISLDRGTPVFFTITITNINGELNTKNDQLSKSSLYDSTLRYDKV